MPLVKTFTKQCDGRNRSIQLRLSVLPLTISNDAGPRKSSVGLRRGGKAPRGHAKSHEAVHYIFHRRRESWRGGTGTNPTAAGAGRANVYPKPLLTTPYSAGALWMPVKLHAYLHP